MSDRRLTHAQIVREVLTNYGPLSDYGIAKTARHKLGVYMTPSSVRTRRHELRAVAVGTEKSPTGVTSNVWALNA